MGNSTGVACRVTETKTKMGLVDSPDSDDPSKLSDELSKLSDEVCKYIFDLHILKKGMRKQLTYEEGTEEVDVRLDQPWVKKMKRKMKAHSSKILRHIFK